MVWSQIKIDSVGPDLGPICLQRLSADDKSCRYHLNSDGRLSIKLNFFELRECTQYVFIYMSHDMIEISNNVVCATSKCSSQPTHTHSLIRIFASLLNILWLSGY